MRNKIGLKDKNDIEIREGDIIEANANGWIQRGIVFYDPPCYKLKWTHVFPPKRGGKGGSYNEIIEFTHPKFYYQKFREIIGTEKDNPEILEGHIQD